MKPGAGQGSPLRVAPCPVQSDTGQNYHIVWGTCPTPRWPCHGDHLLAGPWTRSRGPWWPGPRWVVAPSRKGRWEGRWLGCGGCGGVGRCWLRLCCTSCSSPLWSVLRCCARQWIWSRQCCRGAPQVQFLDQVDMPVTVQRQVRSFSGMSSTPCHGDSHGPSVQKIMEILQMQYIDKVIDVCCAGSRCALSVGDSRDPTVAARFFSDQVVDIPVVSTTGFGVEVQKTATVPQLQHIRQGGRHPCWRSSSTSCGTSCDHAATSGLVLEVPQILFIAIAGGHPVVQQRMVLNLAIMAAVGGVFQAALTHFSRSSG